MDSFADEALNWNEVVTTHNVLQCWRAAVALKNNYVNEMLSGLIILEMKTDLERNCYNWQKLRVYLD